MTQPRGTVAQTPPDLSAGPIPSTVLLEGSDVCDMVWEVGVALLEDVTSWEFGCSVHFQRKLVWLR